MSHQKKAHQLALRLRNPKIDNKITHLGCEFLGKTLKPGAACPPIVFLKLDHNMFGSAGCNALCEGLKTNEMIKTLSTPQAYGFQRCLSFVWRRATQPILLTLREAVVCCSHRHRRSPTGACAYQLPQRARVKPWDLRMLPALKRSLAPLTTTFQDRKNSGPRAA